MSSGRLADGQWPYDTQARQQSAAGAIQLRPPVAAKLRSLQGHGVVAPTDFDSLAMRSVTLLRLGLHLLLPLLILCVAWHRSALQRT